MRRNYSFQTQNISDNSENGRTTVPQIINNFSSLRNYANPQNVQQTLNLSTLSTNLINKYQHQNEQLQPSRQSHFPMQSQTSSSQAIALNTHLDCQQQIPRSHTINSLCFNNNNNNNNNTRKKLFVGNLPDHTELFELLCLFSQYGEIDESLSTVKKSNYAFIHFKRADDAEQAFKGLNNALFKTRYIRVQYSTSDGHIKKSKTFESLENQTRDTPTTSTSATSSATTSESRRPIRGAIQPTQTFSNRRNYYPQQHYNQNHSQQLLQMQHQHQHQQQLLQLQQQQQQQHSTNAFYRQNMPRNSQLYAQSFLSTHQTPTQFNTQTQSLQPNRQQGSNPLQSNQNTNQSIIYNQFPSSTSTTTQKTTRCIIDRGKTYYLMDND